jgi:hypothetical protein
MKIKIEYCISDLIKTLRDDWCFKGIYTNDNKEGTYKFIMIADESTNFGTDFLNFECYQKDNNFNIIVKSNVDFCLEDFANINKFKELLRSYVYES